MRDDAIPRMSPRALVSLQEEALALTWAEIAECAHAWGPFTRTLYDSARWATIPLLCNTPMKQFSAYRDTPSAWAMFRLHACAKPQRMGGDVYAGIKVSVMAFACSGCH
jgi:hypothetical protein